MEFLQIVILALVQGVTEFLPISSSAHLILVPVVVGWPDQGLEIDVAMHVGSLGAVILYFRRDVARLFRGALDLLHRDLTPDARLGLQIVLATLPVVVAGFLLREQVATGFRSPIIIIATTAGFALVLWAADRGADNAKGAVIALTWRDVLIIGLAQALALVPGVSRSGITMTAALFLGLQRSEAARFSLLLSIPTTAAAGSLMALEIARTGDAALQFDALLSALLAFVAAFAAIAGLMAWLKHSNFTPFVVYRLLLATLLAGLLALGLLPEVGDIARSG